MVVVILVGDIRNLVLRALVEKGMYDDNDWLLFSLDSAGVRVMLNSAVLLAS